MKYILLYMSCENIWILPSGKLFHAKAYELRIKNQDRKYIALVNST